MLYTRILWVCALVTAASIGWMVWAPNSGKADDERAAKVAVEQYVRAFVAGDGRAACERLTDTAREAVIAAAGRVDARGCAEAFERTRKLGGTKVLVVASRIKVGTAKISQGRAKVTLSVDGADSVAELDKIGDDWKIASLPKA
jgi:hypothetical protein